MNGARYPLATHRHSEPATHTPGVDWQHRTVAGGRDEPAGRPGTGVVVVVESDPGVPPAVWMARMSGPSVVPVSPSGPATAPSMAMDVLDGLGARTGAASLHHVAVARVWLAAHRVRWLVLANPQLPDAGGVRAAVGLAESVGARTMLACDHGDASSLEAALGIPASARLGLAGAGLLLADTSPAATDPPDAGPCPVRLRDLPEVDFPLFRSECRRVLAADAYDEIDRAYVHGRTAGREWVTAVARDNPLTVARQVDAPVVHAARAVVAASTAERVDVAGSLVVFRGFQAGAFHAGLLVRTETPRLVAALRRIERQPLSSAGWTSLRRWQDPHRAAVTALYLAGASPAEILALTVGDAAAAAGTPAGVPVPVGPFAVDHRARPYVAALHGYRLMEGAGPSDPLLRTPVQSTVVDAINCARSELLLPVARGRVLPDETRADRWTALLDLKVRVVSSSPGPVPASPTPPAAAVVRRPARTDDPGPLDADVIRRARLDAGMLLGTVADAVGVSVATVRFLERDGGVDETTLTLGQVVRLAQVLGLRPGDLWRRPATPGTGPPDPVAPTSGPDTQAGADARTLGALLHHATDDLNLGGTARALGWTPARAATAADTLDVFAAPTGARVVRVAGLIGYRAVLDRDVNAALALVETHADYQAGLDSGEARIAHRAVVQGSGISGDLLRADSPQCRAHLASLLRKGLVDVLPSGSYEASAAFRHGTVDD